MVSSQSRFTHDDGTVIQSLVASDLIDFLVLFIREEGSDETLLGSGTLVSIDNRKAILTADHVLQKCEQPSGNVRLLFPTRFDNPQQSRSKSSTPIPIKDLEKKTIGKGNQPDSGPDLGVLIIPDPVAARFIPSTKTFYNLEKRRRKVVGRPRSIDTGIWVLAGAPAEWTEEASDSDAGSTRVNQQGSLLGFGVVNKEYDQGDFDYLDFLVNYKTHYEGPTRFGGCSGGGLWHIHLEWEASGGIVIKEKILSGVAFYQTRLRDDERIVRCHGRRSIFQKVVVQDTL